MQAPGAAACAARAANAAAAGKRTETGSSALGRAISTSVDRESAAAGAERCGIGRSAAAATWVGGDGEVAEVRGSDAWREEVGNETLAVRGDNILVEVETYSFPSLSACPWRP